MTIVRVLINVFILMRSTEWKATALGPVRMFNIFTYYLDKGIEGTYIFHK